MKIESKIFQLALLLFLSISVFSQEGRAVYEYSITAVKKNSNGSNGFTDGVLYFNKLGYNYYEVNPQKANRNPVVNKLSENKSSITVSVNEDYLFEHYFDIKSNTSYIRDRIFMSYTNYSRENSTPTWNLLNEKKQIGKYLCQKASTNFSGRDWIVWFTAELPYSFGPWKLHGLPGLIVEASDSENKYSFVLKSVQIPENPVYSQIYFLKNENKISKTYAEFIDEKRKKYENLNAKSAGIGGDKIYNSSFKVGETRDIEF